MARTGFSSSNYLNATGSGAPSQFLLSMHLYVPNLAEFFSCPWATSGTASSYARILFSSTETIKYQVNGPGGLDNPSFASCGQGWHHVAMYYQQADKELWCDGVSAITTTLDSGTSSWTQTSLGIQRYTTGTIYPWSASGGLISSVALWSVTSKPEIGVIQALSEGMHPTLWNPGDLAHFWHLSASNDGNVIDQIGGNTAAETGTVTTSNEDRHLTIANVGWATHTPSASGVTGTSEGVVNETTATGAGTTTVTGTSAGAVNATTATGVGTTTVTGTSAGDVNAVTATGAGSAGDVTGTSAGLVNAVTGTGAGTTPVVGASAGQVDGVTATGAGTTTVVGTSAGQVDAITGAGTGTVGSVSGTSAGVINAITGSGTDAVEDERRGGGVPFLRRRKNVKPDFERRDEEKEALRRVIEDAYATATGEQRDMPEESVAEVRELVRPFSTSRAQVRLPRPSTVDFASLAEHAAVSTELLRALEVRQSEDEAAALLLLMAA